MSFLIWKIDLAYTYILFYFIVTFVIQHKYEFSHEMHFNQIENNVIWKIYFINIYVFSIIKKITLYKT